jgi:F-type H+-transporting ATPase subunit delta
MVTGKAQIQQLVRQLFKLSLVDGRISSEQVAGILGYVEKHHPVNAVTILTAYQRLIATEIAKGIAVVEHSGPVSAAVLASIATRGARFFLVAALIRRYGEPVRVFVEGRLTLVTTILAVGLVGGFVALRFLLPR